MFSLERCFQMCTLYKNWWRWSKGSMTFYSFMSTSSFCHLAYGFVERKILLSNLWQTRKMGRIILSASWEAMCIYILGRPYTQRKVSYRSNTVRFIDFKLEIENRDSMLTENPEFRPAAEERSGTWSPDGELGSSSLACRCFTWRDERRRQT